MIDLKDFYFEFDGGYLSYKKDGLELAIERTLETQVFDIGLYRDHQLLVPKKLYVKGIDRVISEANFLLENYLKKECARQNRE